MTTNNPRASRNARGQFQRKATAPTQFVDVVHAERDSCAEDDYLEAKYSEFRSMFKDTAVPHPVLGLITNLAVSAFGVAGAVHAGMWLGLGAALLTTSSFIGLCVATISALYMAIQAMRAGSQAARYVALGEFERDYRRAKGWLSDKFDAWMPRKENSHA